MLTAFTAMTSTKAFSVIGTIIVIINAVTSLGAVDDDVLIFEPPAPSVNIYVDDLLTINVTYNGSVSDVDTVYVSARVARDVMDLDRVSLPLDRTDIQFVWKDGEWTCVGNCIVDVYGLFIGIADIELFVCRGSENCSDPENWTKLPQIYQVLVSRRERKVDGIFTIVMVIFGCCVNLGMGCKIDLEVVKKTLRRPVAPAIGFACQFLFMPVLGFAFGKLFSLSASEAIGLFANGCAPGGGASNMWTLLFNGDLSLSITMTVISTFGALGMYPFWMSTLGRLVTGGNFRIAFENIAITLVGIVVPAIIGILIQKRRPTWAAVITRILKPLIIFILLFMLTFGVWVNFFMFRLFNLRLILAGCSLPWSGFLVGLLVSIAFRRPRAHVVAICLETGIQNAGVAIITLRLSLPQPQNDLSIIGSVAATTFTPVPPILCYIVYAIWRRCHKPDEKIPEVDLDAAGNGVVDPATAPCLTGVDGTAIHNGTETTTKV